MAEFELAIDRVIRNEGGYVNDPRDRGGETKFGISKRSYPLEDIKYLTRDRAKILYKRDFWDKLKLFMIQDQEIANKLLDICVNMGRFNGIKCVQRAVRAASGRELEIDGRLGPVSTKAINESSPDMLLAAYRSEAACTYRSFKQETYEKGWLNRAYQ